MRVLLDTDLGSDVDDELALALLWGSPEAEVVGVSTTYGDVALRARIVLRMAELVGRSVDVAPGEALPASGREVWWAGHEGLAYDALPPLPAQSRSGAALLVEGSDAHLLAIGPLTTVAAALDGGARPSSITIMGGDWTDPSAAEHNLASDSVAAARVLGSGVPTAVVGIDQTRRVRFGAAEVERFARCGRLGAILAIEMRAWMAYSGEEFEVPHDPLTALAMVQPELFSFTEPSAVEVADGAGAPPAGAVRRLDAPGSVRVAVDVDVPAATAALADRIAAGLGERRR